MGGNAIKHIIRYLLWEEGHSLRVARGGKEKEYKKINRQSIQTLQLLTVHLLNIN